ncbi:MAG: molybdenum cofactor guanylyltransferase, partial [Candidatus Acidiferrum sp.]
MLTGERLRPVVRRNPLLRGYVLAGGASARFGRDKALMELVGKPLLTRTLGVMGESGVREMLVVGERKKYGRFGARCIRDQWPGEGPLGGIITALNRSVVEKYGYYWNLIVSCDMPFLTGEWLKFLAQRARNSDAQVVLAHSAQGPESLCACWRTDAIRTLRPAFERGVRKVTQGIALLRAEVLDEKDWKRFDSAGRLFWNMNTPADYEEARRILEAEQT